MAPEPQSRGPVLAVVGLIALSGVAAVAVLLKGGGAPPEAVAARAAAARPSRAWPDEPPPRLKDPELIRAEPSGRSGLDMVGRPDDAVAPPMGGADGAAAPTAAKASGDAGPAAGKSAVELSEAEKAALAKAAGGDLEDPRKAAEVGGSDGPWTAVLGALGRSPRLLNFLLNNDAVVKAFMSRETSQRYCRSAGAYKGYLTNTKAPGGVTHAMNVFEKVLHGSSENPTIMFGSKLGGAITNCPSVQSLVKDNASIQEIATANPRMLGLMMDPALMKGLTANPAAMTAFGGIQSTLSGKP